jgi:hypothetical protein
MFDLCTGTPKKFADLRQWNEPKNFRICFLRALKISFLAHLCK